ncbi:MAG: hypothetical protein SOZ89_02450 [Peptoniphilaceae bacterium]|nr:hypothetical protein [Peptoniphilaceae bacterium]MDD7382806.1 hypothetical protein [Peptoniphilaceae bacterium]MDY3737964.1 hypothetical protein [Peptoniphilaceae bacterium]
MKNKKSNTLKALVLATTITALIPTAKAFANEEVPNTNTEVTIENAEEENIDAVTKEENVASVETNVNENTNVTNAETDASKDEKEAVTNNAEEVNNEEINDKANTEITTDKEEKEKLEEQLISLKENLANIDQNTSEGAFYFLEWIKKNNPEYANDAENALKILKEFEAKGDVKRGVDGDATSFKNLLKTSEFLVENNNLRVNDENFDVEEQYTNFTILAKAMVSANRSTNALNGHRGTFNVAENLAWGYNDPFDGWYTKEKKLYNANHNEKYEKIGHYLNIMNKDLKLVAIAQNDNPKLNERYSVTHALNSDRITNNDLTIEATKYVEIIESYKKELDKKVLEEKIAEIEEKLLAYNTSEEDHKSIPWKDIEDIAKAIEKEDHKSIPWKNIEDITKAIEKEQSEDEKWKVKPDDDKAIKDKIAELTATKKETKEDETTKTIDKTVADKTSTTNPKTGVSSITGLLGLTLASASELVKRKKYK